MFKDNLKAAMASLMGQSRALNLRNSKKGKKIRQALDTHGAQC